MAHDYLAVEATVELEPDALVVVATVVVVVAAAVIAVEVDASGCRMTTN